MTHEPNHRGRLALVATRRYKVRSIEEFRAFLLEFLHPIAMQHDIVSTGRTHSEIDSLIQSPLVELRELGAACFLERDLGFIPRTEQDVDAWRTTILDALQKYEVGTRGLIRVANDLVEGRLDGVFHFHEPEDLTSKPGSLVLRREANVHDIPTAMDRATASVMAGHFGRNEVGEQNGARRAGTAVDGTTNPDRVIGLIAHDGKKLDLCRFVVEHAEQILEYDRILTTGTTGAWVRKFLQATGCSCEELSKIRACLSGPEGGDVQIAKAVLAGLCKTVIFFEDPWASLPHEVDVRWFAQTVIERRDVRFATNASSARLLLARHESKSNHAGSVR